MFFLYRMAALTPVRSLEKNHCSTTTRWASWGDQDICHLDTTWGICLRRCPTGRRPRGRPRNHWSDYIGVVIGRPKNAPGLPWLNCRKSQGRGHLYSDCDPHDPAPDQQSRLTEWRTHKRTLWRITVLISANATCNIICTIKKKKNIYGWHYCFFEIKKKNV